MMRFVHSCIWQDLDYHRGRKVIITAGGNLYLFGIILYDIYGNCIRKTILS